VCAPYTYAYESIAVCAPYTYAYESGVFEIRGGEGGEEGYRATDGNTANPYIRVCVCVCARVRACDDYCSEFCSIYQLRDFLAIRIYT